MTVEFIYRSGKLIPLQPDKMERVKAALSEGQTVLSDWVAIEGKRRRSEQQFRMLHAVIRDLSRGLGINYPSMKDQVCCLWGVAVTLQEATSSGLIPSWPGHLVQPWDDGVFWIRKSTTAYTIEEMTALIQGCHQMALENGVEVTI